MHTNQISFRFRPGVAAPARFAALLGAAVVADGFAQDGTVPMDEYVVSATRSVQDPWYTASAVTRLDLDSLNELQIEDLRSALAREPGIVIVDTGAPGGQSTVFMRGASGHQTLFVVDGIRMNDRSAAYSNFLGGAGLSGVDRLEVLRGPQSTLYGSSAMGGAIVLETARAAQGLHGALAASGGSFGTAGGGGALRVGTETLGATAALERRVTANDREGNHFKSTAFAGRLEGRVAEGLRLGVTYRGDFGDYEEPGSRLFASPGVIDSRNHLATGYALVALDDALSTRITTGLHRREYSFASAWGTTKTENTRKVVDLQNTWAITPTTELVFGGNYERSTYDINAERSRDELLAGFVSAVVRPVEQLTLTGGFRHDDFDSVGGAATWRGGAAWLLGPGTKLRANYGTGFSAPGSDDRFGVAQWGQRGNPDILPEKSRGWDVGIDQELFDGRLAASATWFHNSFRNLFEWETVDFTTFEGRTVNRARASTEGVELALDAVLAPALSTRLAYTYLDAHNDSDGIRLIRRPRHTIDADVTIRATQALLLGIGVRAVADRTDSTGRAEDYTTARIHATWTAREDLRLRLRVENAFDETYEDVVGYPALPRAFFGSMEWTF
jgi:vitamin B12 transporter